LIPNQWLDYALYGKYQLPTRTYNKIYQNSSEEDDIYGSILTDNWQPNLLIVDGVLINMSFAEAFVNGLVDVPVLFGNMAFESAPLSVNQGILSNHLPKLDNITAWQSLLNQTFANWTSDTSTNQEIAQNVYILYEQDAQDDPSLAYHRMISDIGIFCPNIELITHSDYHRNSSLYFYYNGKIHYQFFDCFPYNNVIYLFMIL
jgi:hypothetical protein